MTQTDTRTSRLYDWPFWRSDSVKNNFEKLHVPLWHSMAHRRSLQLLTLLTKPYHQWNIVMFHNPPHSFPLIPTPKSLCGTFRAQESPAARSLVCTWPDQSNFQRGAAPPPPNRNEVTSESESSLSLCLFGGGSSFLWSPLPKRVASYSWIYSGFTIEQLQMQIVNQYNNLAWPPSCPPKWLHNIWTARVQVNHIFVETCLWFYYW